MNLAVVRWRDAHATNEMRKPDEVMEDHKPHIVTSAGFVFHEDKTGISLVRDVDQDGAVDGHLFIPRGMIIGVNHKP